MTDEVAQPTEYNVIETKQTGVSRFDEKCYPGNLRFKDGVLQEQWECRETNHDDDTGRTWKEWRNIPEVNTE